MKIQELAKKIGVSRQTIYNRLKRDGIPFDTFRNAETGDITESGLEWAMTTFVNEEGQKVSKSSKKVSNAKLTQILTEDVETLKAKLTAQEEYNRILREQLEDAKKHIEELQEDKRFLQETVSRLTLPKLMQAEEQKEEGQKKKSLWARLTGK